MNVCAASAFVDVSERVMDIIKRRVKSVKKGPGAKAKEGAGDGKPKGGRDSKKAVSLTHLQASIADTMSIESFQREICKVVGEQVSRVRVEHFRRFRDYLRAMKRFSLKGMSGGALDAEAQQKVMVRIRRAVLEELSNRQHLKLARAMKVGGSTHSSAVAPDAGHAARLQFYRSVCSHVLIACCCQ